MGLQRPLARQARPCAAPPGSVVPGRTAHCRPCGPQMEVKPGEGESGDDGPPKPRLPASGGRQPASTSRGPGRPVSPGGRSTPARRCERRLACRNRGPLELPLRPPDCESSSVLPCPRWAAWDARSWGAGARGPSASSVASEAAARSVHVRKATEEPRSRACYAAAPVPLWRRRALGRRLFKLTSHSCPLTSPRSTL